MNKKQKHVFDPSKCIPYANINDYYLHIFPDVPVNCKTGIIGVIGNYSNTELKLNIIIDDDFMYARNYRTICISFDCNNYSQTAVILTSSFWKALEENEFLYASIWHEVGHFHTTRYFNTHFDGKSSNIYREELLNKGEIMPEEKVADLFALYYTSKEDVINELHWLMKARKAREWEPDKVKMRAVYELGKRKRYLSSFASEKDIEDEMCRLCGVPEFGLI